MPINIFSKAFVKDATIRGIRTFCQTLGSVLGGSALNVWTVGWHSAVGVAAGSALISFLMTVDRYTAFVDRTVDTPVDSVSI
jgi:hypothetical protein